MPRYERWKWRLSPRKHRQILEYLRRGVGILTTAKLVGVGTRSVQIRAEFLRERQLASYIKQDSEPVDFRKNESDLE